jgi:hypothetical protein
MKPGPKRLGQTCGLPQWHTAQRRRPDAYGTLTRSPMPKLRTGLPAARSIHACPAQAPPAVAVRQAAGRFSLGRLQA